MGWSGKQGTCGRMGWCEAGRCRCVALYVGDKCDAPRPNMPQGMSSEFNGNFIFNRQRLRVLAGLMLKYTTNPKVRCV